MPMKVSHSVCSSHRPHALVSAPPPNPSQRPTTDDPPGCRPSSPCARPPTIHALQFRFRLLRRRREQPVGEGQPIRDRRVLDDAGSSPRPPRPGVTATLRRHRRWFGPNLHHLVGTQCEEDEHLDATAVH